MDDGLLSSEVSSSQIPIPEQLRVLADELRVSKATIDDAAFLDGYEDRTDIAYVRDRLIEIAALLEGEGS